MLLLTAYGHPKQLHYESLCLHFGRLISPHRMGSLEKALELGYPLAGDNDCYTGFDRYHYLRLINRLGVCRPLPKSFLFLTLPDVVGDALRTAHRAAKWLPRLHARGIPPAYVLQDGIRLSDVPWDDIAAVFIGGTTEFKLGPVAAEIAQEAKIRGKWVHMGRVNTASRFQYAFDLGCDSVDGSSFARFPGRYLPNAKHWLEVLHSGGRIM